MAVASGLSVSCLGDIPCLLRTSSPVVAESSGDIRHGSAQSPIGSCGSMNSALDAVVHPSCMSPNVRWDFCEFLGSIGCWNTRGAFSQQSDLAAAKLAYFWRHLGQCQLSALLETHCSGHEQQALSLMPKVFWSPHPEGRPAGGICVCCRDKRVAENAEFQVVVPSRIVVVHVSDRCIHWHVAFVHLYAGDDEPPVYAMLDKLHSCVNLNEGPWVIVGDFNSVSHGADRCRREGDCWQCDDDIGDKSWETISERFGSFTEVVAGNFTYCASGVIDKALVSVTPTDVLSYNITIATTTASWSVSDHLPIILSMGSAVNTAKAFTMVPRWVLKEPAYQHITLSLLHQHEWPPEFDAQHNLLMFLQEEAWCCYRQESHIC